MLELLVVFPSCSKEMEGRKIAQAEAQGHLTHQQVLELLIVLSSHLREMKGRETA